MACTDIYSSNFKRISMPKKASLANGRLNKLELDLDLDLDLEDEEDESGTNTSSTSTLRSLANATVCTHKSWNSLSMFQLKSTTPSRFSIDKTKSTIKQKKPTPSLASSSSSSYVNDWLQRQTQHYRQFIFQKRKDHLPTSSSSPSSSYLLFSFSKSNSSSPLISSSPSSYITNSTKISSSMASHSNSNREFYLSFELVKS